MATSAKKKKVTKPKLTRKEQRRASISAAIEAATEQFSRLGYEGASLNVIATNSGVSKQNILYYFGSKEKLWIATVDDVFGKVEAALDEYRGPIDQEIVHSLKDLIRHYFALAERYPAYVLIPMIEGLNDTWRSKMLGEKYLAPHVAAYEKRIRWLVERGDISDVPSIHLQNIVTGGAQQFIAQAPIWRYATSLDTKSEEFLESYAETVIRLLTRE